MKNVTLLTALLLVSAACWANTDKLAELDTDNDGRISKEEAAQDPTLATIFAELDKDNDGYLSKQELAS